MSGELEPTVPPDGWLEVGGFVLAETIAAIAPLELDQLLGRLQRALPSSARPARDAALEAHLKAGSTSRRPRPGLTDTVFHPAAPPPGGPRPGRPMAGGRPCRAAAPCRGRGAGGRSTRALPDVR